MSLTGQKLKSMMRKHHVTIRELKSRTGITMKRIREVLDSELVGVETCRDWIQAITGIDPGNGWYLKQE